MRSMRTDRKLKLEQEFICHVVSRIPGAPQLPPYLAELARPIRQDEGCALVAQRRVRRTIGTVAPCSDEPAPPELVVAGHVETRRVLKSGRLIAAAPDDLGPPDERAVDRP